MSPLFALIEAFVFASFAVVAGHDAAARHIDGRVEQIDGKCLLDRATTSGTIQSRLKKGIEITAGDRIECADDARVVLVLPGGGAAFRFIGPGRYVVPNTPTRPQLPLETVGGLEF